MLASSGAFGNGAFLPTGVASAVNNEIKNSRSNAVGLRQPGNVSNGLIAKAVSLRSRTQIASCCRSGGNALCNRSINPLELGPISIMVMSGRRFNAGDRIAPRLNVFSHTDLPDPIMAQIRSTQAVCRDELGWKGYALPSSVRNRIESLKGAASLGAIERSPNPGSVETSPATGSPISVEICAIPQPCRARTSVDKRS